MIMFNDSIHHKKVLLKHLFPVFFSKFWRETLFQAFPSFLIAGLALSVASTYSKSLAVLAGIFLLIYSLSISVFILLTNTSIMNKLSSIPYKRVTLEFKYNWAPIGELSFYDALRVKMSFVWRRAFVYGLELLIFIGLAQALPINIFVEIVEDSSKILAVPTAFIAFWWTMRRKKTGCHIVLEPKE
jgi:hypothetical protein